MPLTPGDTLFGDSDHAANPVAFSYHVAASLIFPAGFRSDWNCRNPPLAAVRLSSTGWMDIPPVEKVSDKSSWLPILARFIAVNSYFNVMPKVIARYVPCMKQRLRGVIKIKNTHDIIVIWF